MLCDLVKFGWFSLATRDIEGSLLCIPKAICLVVLVELV